MNVFAYGQTIGRKYKIFESEEFTQLTNPNFKLILFASNSYRESSIGVEIFEKLLEFNRAHGFNNFEYYLRSRETMPERWSPRYIKKRIGNPTRILKGIIASDHKHKEELLDLLKKSGLPERIITIL